MFLALALVMTESPQVRLNQLIAQWCSAHSANASARCVASQSDGLRKFQRVATALYDPDRALASTCLRKSAVAPSLNWVAAGNCLQNAAIDRDPSWRSPENDLRPTPLPDLRWVPFSPGVR